MVDARFLEPAQQETDTAQRVANGPAPAAESEEEHGLTPQEYLAHEGGRLVGWDRPESAEARFGLARHLGNEVERSLEEVAHSLTDLQVRPAGESDSCTSRQYGVAERQREDQRGNADSAVTSNREPREA